MNMSGKGEKADLSLICEHGRIVVNLQLHLAQGPPAPFHPNPAPHPQPQPYHHYPSPSWLWRSERRCAQALVIAEQAITKSDRTEKVSFNPVIGNDKTEKSFKVESQDVLVPAEQAISAEGNDAKKTLDKKDDEET